MNKIILSLLLLFFAAISYAGSPFVFEAVSGKALPAQSYVHENYNDLQYYLVNTATAQAAYRLTLVGAPGVGFRAGSTCDTAGVSATLPAGGRCIINLAFDAGETPGAYSHNVVSATFEPWGGDVALRFTTTINAQIETMIVFGDSLSAMDSSFQGYTNNDPTVGKKNWVSDIASEIASPEQAFVIRHETAVNPENKNVDYALGGAKTFTPSGGVIGLGDQVERYADDLSAYQETPGANTKVIIWMGGNDVLGDLTNPGSTVTPAISNIHEAITNLVSIGIQTENIYVVNLPNLGTIPATHNTSAAEALTTASENFRTELNTMLTTDFPTAHWIDEFTISSAILANPAEYQAPGHPAFNPAIKLQACSSGSSVNACEGYIFWDSIHPSVASHLLIKKMIADCIWQGQCGQIS